ncbi:MAG: hypothetical protein LBG96_18250 [Tannerella sp.]|jgi:hypothetical protein|nr:hypothetical protein [Tannerella sp.]
MKQLILTFFAVILCYSLFFDNETEKSVSDEINYIYEDTLSPDPYLQAPDTLNYFTLYNCSTGWNFSDLKSIETTLLK